jgi:hypothetical protein
MSRPPLKAVKQLQNWCSKTRCRKCPFMGKANPNAWIFTDHCVLHEYMPDGWVDELECIWAIKKEVKDEQTN